MYYGIFCFFSACVYVYMFRLKEEHSPHHSDPVHLLNTLNYSGCKHHYTDTEPGPKICRPNSHDRKQLFSLNRCTWVKVQHRIFEAVRLYCYILKLEAPYKVNEGRLETSAQCWAWYSGLPVFVSVGRSSVNVTTAYMVLF